MAVPGRVVFDERFDYAGSWSTDRWAASSTASGGVTPDITTDSVPEKIQDLGTATSNASTNSLTVTYSGGTMPVAGDLVVVMGSRDNYTSDPLNTDAFTDNVGNTYTRVINGSSVATAAAGIVGVMFYSVLTASWVGGGQALTWSWTTAVTAKAMRIEHWTNVAGLRASGSGSGVSTAGAPSVTNTTPVTGDLVIGMAAIEHASSSTVTADSDTVNGSWSAQSAQVAGGGTLLTGAKVVTQSKIVTGTGSQTYNVTNSTTTSVDAVAIIAVFTPITANPDHKGRLRINPITPNGDWVRQPSTQFLPPDFELEAAYSIGDTLEHYWTLYFRAGTGFATTNPCDPFDGWSVANFDTAGQYALLRDIGGVRTTVASATPTGTQFGYTNYIRVRCEGPSILVRIWRSDTQEPTGWTFRANDANSLGRRVCGVTLIQGTGPNVHTITWYYIKVTELIPGRRRKAGIRGR